MFVITGSACTNLSKTAKAPDQMIKESLCVACWHGMKVGCTVDGPVRHSHVDILICDMCTISPYASCDSTARLACRLHQQSSPLGEVAGCNRCVQVLGCKVAIRLRCSQLRNILVHQVLLTCGRAMHMQNTRTLPLGMRAGRSHSVSATALPQQLQNHHPRCYDLKSLT